MSKWSNATYVSDATQSRYGLMVCCSCHQPIENGSFRVRETRDAYITQHRTCSSDAPGWAQMDRDHTIFAARQAEMKSDAIAFVAKWGVVDLDEVVSEADPS